MYRFHTKATGISADEHTPDFGCGEATGENASLLMPQLHQIQTVMTLLRTLTSLRQSGKQIAMFYIRIMEKLQLPLSTTDEIFTLVKALIHDVIEGMFKKTAKLLEEKMWHCAQ